MRLRNAQFARYFNMKVKRIAFINLLVLILFFIRSVLYPFMSLYYASVTVNGQTDTDTVTILGNTRFERLKDINNKRKNTNSIFLRLSTIRRPEVEITNSRLTQLEISNASTEDIDPLKWKRSTREKKENTKTRNKNNCKPKINIVFVKLHKCASSTIQNMLIRYGLKHGLTFALPSGERHMFSIKEPFSTRQGIMNEEIGTFNIFTQHAIFNENQIRKIVSQDAMFLTILRSPSKMFESIFTYFRFPYLFGIDNEQDPLKMFLTTHNVTKKHKTTNGHDRYSRNPMLYDLGYPYSSTPEGNKYNTLNYIEYLDRIFDLVLMSDYFDESLILMKELLCMSLEDITYFSLNARAQRNELEKEHTDLINTWNEADYLLYSYFNKTFWKKINIVGYDKINEEVLKLREMNSKLQETCVSKVLNHSDLVWHPENVDIQSFELKDSAKKSKVCIQMTTTEKIFTDIIKRKQNAHFGVLK